MSAAIEELPARMAWVSDLIDGRVTGRWEDQPDETRRAYRRAVEGDVELLGSERVAAAVAYLRVATMQQIHGDSIGMLCPHPPETGHGWPRGMAWAPGTTQEDNLATARALIDEELRSLKEDR